MYKKFLFPTFISILAILFASCSDNEKPIDIDPTNNKTVLILSEGSFNENNSTLAKYDIETGTYIKDYFVKVNNRGLGSLGNDLLLYGSKLYIVMNASGTIEVIDKLTGKSIRQIPMKLENKTSKLPRQIIAHSGKVYVTSTDDTVTRIDTITLEQDASITVGLDPEGLEISNNKIYVANSGGYSIGFNNTVSVIDIASFRVEEEIVVGVNPMNLGKDNRGNIYLSTLGDYFQIPGVFQKISSIGDVTTIEEITTPGKFVIYDNKAYIIQGSYGNPYKVIVYDCLTEQVISDNFITDSTEIDIIHSIDVDVNSGDIFIMESDYVTPGTIYCFSKEGKLQYKIPSIGINPTAVIRY